MVQNMTVFFFINKMVSYTIFLLLWRGAIDGFLQCSQFTFMHLADTFIQSDLHCIQVIIFFVSTCQ